MQHEQQT